MGVFAVCMELAFERTTKTLNQSWQMPRLICLHWVHMPLCWFSCVMAHYHYLSFASVLCLWHVSHFKLFPDLCMSISAMKYNSTFLLVKVIFIIPLTYGEGHNLSHSCHLLFGRMLTFAVKFCIKFINYSSLIFPSIL